MCPLGKDRSTTSIRLERQMRQARMLGKTDAKTDHTSRGPTQCVRSARTEAQLPSASEDQHNVFARQEPKHNFHQPHARRGPMQDTTGAPMTQRPSAVMNHVPATRNIPHGATPRKNEVETPEIQRKTIGGRVGPGRQAKHTRTVTGAQTFVKQNGRNTSNDTSLLTRVPCVS